MKQMMLDLMVKMMPLMMPLVYAGAALLVIGVLAIIMRLSSGTGQNIARLSGWILVGLGLFFLASQAAGMLLGATPSINFGDSTKFEFDLKPFWQIGLGMFVPGLLIALIGGRIAKKT
jgi:hypothetical protein